MINRKLLLFSILGLYSNTIISKDKRPNILWIMIEDWSTDLSCYGTKGINTPVVDNLAKKGVLYKNAYTTAPVSSTARSAMMTGYYEGFIGANQHVEYNKKKLPDGIYPIPILMKNAGYHTHLLSLKVDCNFLPCTRKELFEDTRLWSQHKPGTPFFKDDVKDGKPFFARITFMGTHRPWKNRDSLHPIDIKDVELPPYYADTPFNRRDWANGLEQMQVVDKEIGLLLKQLKDEGLEDNTIVIFMGDNGSCHFRGKQFLYEPGTHVPLIIKWNNNNKAGSVNNDLVSSLDIGATALELAGVKTKIPLHGLSLLNDETRKRKYIFTSRDRMGETHDAMRAIRSKDGYKLILNLIPERPYMQYSGYKENSYPMIAEMMCLYYEKKLTKEQMNFFSMKKPEIELYNLNTDPFELNNLADDTKYNDIKNKLLNELNDWRKNVIHDKPITEEFKAIGVFPQKCPTISTDRFVFENKNNYDFKLYGFPSWFPTRSYNEWEKIRNDWKVYLFRDPKVLGKTPDYIVADYELKNRMKKNNK